MSAYSMASIPANSQPFFMAKASPSAQRQNVCSYQRRLVEWSEPGFCSEATRSSSISCSYDCKPTRFMPGLRWSNLVLVRTLNFIIAQVWHPSASKLPHRTARCVQGAYS